MRVLRLHTVACRRQPLRSQVALRTRAFHATSRRSSGLIETALSGIHELMQLEHSWGLPWGVVLPLTALLFRGAFILPATIYARKLQQRYLDLIPLRQAYRHVIRMSVVREHGHLGPGWCDNEARRRLRAQLKAIYKEMSVHNVRRVALGPAVQLLVFLPVIEVVRKMTGYRAGLLGHSARLLGGEGDANSEVDGAAGAEPEAAADAQDTQHDLGAQAVQNEAARAAANDLPPSDHTSMQDLHLDTGPEMIASGWSVASDIPQQVQDTAIATPTVVSDQGIGIEPGLATEGLFWFENLLVPDPTITLPCTVAAVTAANVYVLSYSARRANISTFSRRVGRVQYTISLALFYITLQIPAALTWYWFCSSFFNLVQHLALEVWRPLRFPPKTTKKKMEMYTAKVKLRAAQLAENGGTSFKRSLLRRKRESQGAADRAEAGNPKFQAQLRTGSPKDEERARLKQESKKLWVNNEDRLKKALSGRFEPGDWATMVKDWARMKELAKRAWKL